MIHYYQEKDGVTACVFCGTVRHKDVRGTSFCEGRKGKAPMTRSSSLDLREAVARYQKAQVAYDALVSDVRGDAEWLELQDALYGLAEMIADRPYVLDAYEAVETLGRKRAALAKDRAKMTEWAVIEAEADASRTEREIRSIADRIHQGRHGLRGEGT